MNDGRFQAVEGKKYKLKERDTGCKRVNNRTYMFSQNLRTKFQLMHPPHTRIENIVLLKVDNAASEAHLRS